MVMTRKGKPKKRTMHTVVVEQRQQKVAELYLSGKPQHVIGEIVGVTQAQISHDLKALREQWRQSAEMSFGDRQALELAKVDQLEEFAWEMLRKSSEDSEVDSREVEKQLRAAQTGGQGNHGPYRLRIVKELTKHSRKGQAGSPAWAQQILNCIEVRCRMFGVIKPDSSTTNVNVNVLNWTQLLEGLQGTPPVDPIEARIQQALQEGPADGDNLPGPGGAALADHRGPADAANADPLPPGGGASSPEGPPDEVRPLGPSGLPYGLKEEVPDA